MDNLCEHKLINVFMTRAQKPLMPDYTNLEEQKSLNFNIDKDIREISSNLASDEGGGWIIVSHDITQLKGAVLLSVLVQRPRL